MLVSIRFVFSDFPRPAREVGVILPSPDLALMMPPIPGTDRSRAWPAAPRTRTATALIIAGLSFLACEAPDPTVVAEAQSWTLTRDEVTADFARINAGSAIEDASIAERTLFLTDRINAELLARHARASLGELSWPQRRRLWAEREEALIDRYFEGTWTTLEIHPRHREEGLAKLLRQADLRRIVTSSVDQARECRHQIEESGMSFVQAYEEYGLDDGTPSTALELGWTSAEYLPGKVVRGVFLDDPPVGAVLGPFNTRRGIWILEVGGFREAIPTAVEREILENRLRSLFYDDSLRTLAERRHEEVDLRVYEEQFPVLNRCFNAFWDSISVASPRANTNVFRTWRAPEWHLAPDERDLDLYAFGDSSGTVLDFMRALNRCDTQYWPGGPSPQHRAREIRSRVDRMFLLTEAERLGLDQDPEFLAAMHRAENEAYLDDLFERVIRPGIQVTPEEAIAEYERDPNAFRIPEKVAFAALLVPREIEGTIRTFREEHLHAPVRDWMLAARELAAIDSTVVLIRDSGVLRLDETPRDRVLRALLPHAEPLTTSEVSEVLELPEGFGLLRCSYRVEARPIEREMAMPFAEAAVRRRKVDERVDALIEKLRREARVKVYPDHLTSSVGEDVAS
jgi:hypothetical protein